MRRKKHTEKEVHADLVSIVSVRLREGYSIREVNITKGDSSVMGLEACTGFRTNCAEHSAGSAILAECWYMGKGAFFPKPWQSLFSVTIAGHRIAQDVCTVVYLLIICACGGTDKLTFFILVMSPHSCKKTNDITCGFGEFSRLSSPFPPFFFLSLSSLLPDALRNINTKLSPSVQKIQSLLTTAFQTKKLGEPKRMFDENAPSVRTVTNARKTHSVVLFSLTW